MQRLIVNLSDRYAIERELGQGGMATVYLARDLKHDRNVAIKVLKPELGAVLGVERFLSEIKVTANLQHPNLLPLFDSGAADGLLYYVMPYVEGETLRARLDRERQLPVDETLRLVTLMAAALDYAHARGVVHRDLKPENILLQAGQPVIADFGIALAVAHAGGSRVTETGLSLGTPQYMSPEQATADRIIDARSDQYSLGAVAYEMLTGEPPHTGATAQAIIARLLTETPRSVRATRPNVAPAVDYAVLRALAKPPADRFASCGEFVRTAADTSGVVAVSAPGSMVRRRALQLAGVTVLVLAAIGYAIFGRGRSGPAVPGSIRSIAVLPLDNYSADSTQEYFAEGMTDELTSDLATISQLRVTSRGSATQFKGKNRPPAPQIAQALNVDAIVEGSVVRSGETVRITAQLIDARADKHLWGQSFERKSGDVLALQAEMASAIASAINIRLTAGEQSRFAAVPSVDPAAHEAYLKGRFFFNRPSDANLQKAIAQFDTVVQLSPTFAPAFSGLSDAYIWAAYNEGISAVDAKPRVKAAAERAVQLDSMSAEAHTSLGVYKGWFEYDWDGCERELRRAIALNPSYAYAYDQLNQVLGIVGRFDEAIAEGQRAVALDPLSPSIVEDLATTLAYAGKAAATRDLARKAADLDPTFFFPPATEGILATQTGDYGTAITMFGRSRSLGAPPFITAYLTYAYAISGDRTRAMATLAELKKMSPGGEVAPFDLALVYLGLGDRARAIDYLEQAYTACSELLVWLKIDRIYDPLRSEPRFIALMKRLNFVK